jgi:hypothetical protein
MFNSLMLFPFERHLSTDTIWRLVVLLKRVRFVAVPCLALPFYAAAHYVPSLQVMIRHSKKEAMRNVPTPICEVIMMASQASEKRSYNSVLSFIRANVVLTSMKGKEESAKQDSLLEQPKELRNAMLNMRILCNGKWTFTILIEQSKRVC